MVDLSTGLADLRDWYVRSGRPPAEFLEQERVHNWEIAR
jgi:hypothetical protein